MECIRCGLTISTKRQRRHAKYCSVICRHEAQKDGFRKMNPKPILASATAGAVAEYRVVVDLLNRGFEVFRSVSPACSCDLAILADTRLFRVEVRSNKYSATGKAYTIPTKPVKADILASVFFDKIIYEPPLPRLPLP